MNGDTITPEELEIRSLKSQIAGLQVNRDSLFEENTRFRADLARTTFCFEKTQQTIKELRSEHEGKMDGYHEITYQLQQHVRELELELKRPEDLRIEVVQLAGNRYFWVLANNEGQLARSRDIDSKDVIGKAAGVIAFQLKLPVWVNERERNGLQT